MSRCLVIGALVCLLGSPRVLPVSAADPVADDLFARKNLVAWCIVPFDAKKRGPEERAAMLEKLGFSHFAYDYRAEHIPTFDAEIEALQRHHVELSAWWFPGSLNDEAKMTLALFAKHHVTPQLWVTGGGEPTKTVQEQQQRVRDEAARIRPIAEAAAKIGCKVALYNHGGWFGEPENQIAIIRQLELSNVGIVYNLHHGHGHLDRFPALLQQMKPYLLTLNLNGMVTAGDKNGQKILQLGQGELDLKLLQTIRNSGYSGPIGIIGHTSDDAEERLRDNLDGLDWLVPQLTETRAGPKPKTRTPVPVATNPAAVTGATKAAKLVDGKFGQALNGRAGGAWVAGKKEFREFPLTVECWANVVDHQPFNILVANERKSSGTHWELFTMAGSGNLTAYLPGFAPDHCHSPAMICDGKWHHLALVLEQERVRLFVDGQQVANQVHERSSLKTEAGALALASLVDQQLGCSGAVDEVRISRGVRAINVVPDKPFTADETTIALWHLDEVTDQKRFEDVTKRNPALVDWPAPGPLSATGKGPKIEGHWGEDVVGFRWTESSSRDDRFGQMDTGPFFSGSITGAGSVVYKGIVVRLGDQRTASICYDTELLRASAGWTGFLKFDAARFGIIVPPKIDGKVTFSTPPWAGWTRGDQFNKLRESSPYGGLPQSQAHYEGLYRHGQRVVLKYTIGTEPILTDSQRTSVTATSVLESPWLEQTDDASAISRTLLVGPSTTPLQLLVADKSARVRLISPAGAAELKQDEAQNRILFVKAHETPVTLKLLIAESATSDAAFDQLVAISPPAEDLQTLIQPAGKIWGEPLVTTGEVAPSDAALVVDTITLPFENPFHALMFCGGHDFLPDGRALLCTLHGDVWLVDGLDDTLRKITWRRFATGLFQPLGLKVVTRPANPGNNRAEAEIYVVGRDQITRLRDANNDGEADFYENFNNDASVSLNGHEYVTCLETDRAGNFYYVKGNSNSAIPHDGCVLQVSADGKQLQIYATGFRNSNGIGMGPRDELTVSPQEGEWTPGSAVFAVHQGGFYGGMMSHHQATPPTDFERPICWFPRLADNSSGGQVWVPENHWGPLGNHMLHMSYGQCRLRLIVQEPLSTSATGSSLPGPIARTSFAGQQRSPLVSLNGASTELPLSFASGVHRGRFNPQDGHLYLTGLKGWTTSAANDGCFQRVRYTGDPVNSLVGMKTYQNGVALTFSCPLNRDDAENLDNYELESWNYLWSAKYGSPDFKPSAPNQIGRDSLEPKSVTLLEDQHTLFFEIPELKPVDQLGISYSLRSVAGTALEQSAYLTLNGVRDAPLPEAQLNRSGAKSSRAELQSRLRPGLWFETGANKSTDTQHRMLAWSRGAESQSQPAVHATGYLKAPAKGDYLLNNATGSDVTLTVIGDAHLIGAVPVKIRLRKGLNEIRLSQDAATRCTAVRLMWESSRFPYEAIPATALFHDQAQEEPTQELQDVVTGRRLFASHKCAQCHIMDANQAAQMARGTAVEQLRAAPSLQGIGSRVNDDWLVAWLKNPAALRHDATMPASPVTQQPESLADLVAYLMSLRNQSETDLWTESVSATEVASRGAAGAELYEKLGCIACHSFAAADPHVAWNRVSLQSVATKFRSGQLARFLIAPHQFHTGSGMPDFHLTDVEAKNLAAFIAANSKGTLPASGKFQAGSVDRGRTIFVEARCDHCHQTSKDDKWAAPDLALPLDAAASNRGCLADESNNPRTAPNFSWKAAERQALRMFLTKTAEGKADVLGPIEAPLSHLIRTLRCNACHTRDATAARWPEIAAEEGSGKLPETIPSLTWVGEKLQGPWITQVLQGKNAQKPRPWLTARMPAFPAYAELVGHGFAEEHGVSYAEDVPLIFDAEQVEFGRRLTLRDGGLDCRQCHGLGKEMPRGDAATQLAPGINFAQTRDRLRPEFVLRQILDPSRYDSNSRMPKFAADLRTTAIKQIQDGDARKQFESIKQYLFSLPVEE